MPLLGFGSPVEYSVLTGRAVPRPPVLDNRLRTGSVDSGEGFPEPPQSGGVVSKVSKEDASLKGYKHTDWAAEVARAEAERRRGREPAQVPRSSSGQCGDAVWARCQLDCRVAQKLLLALDSPPDRSTRRKRRSWPRSAQFLVLVVRYVSLFQKCQVIT